MSLCQMKIFLTGRMSRAASQLRVIFHLFPHVLGRVAYPVEPFSFHFGARDTLPSLLDSHSDRLGNQARLFGQPEDCQTDQL
jgi:hypothetical protein